MNTNTKTPPTFSDMSGDPVYDYLKSKANRDVELVGAQIIEPARHSFNSPRKIIVVEVLIDGKPRQFSYNYLKLKREIE
jgi:hypothetical protein